MPLRAPLIVVVASLAASLLASRPLAAQMIDENQPTKAAEASRYQRESRLAVEAALARWKATWADDDAAALAAAYTSDAVIVMADTTVRGRAAIRAWLERTLPKTGSAALTIDDFLVTDEVAIVSGQLTYVVYTPNDGSEQRTGPYTAVLRHDWNRGWQVRSWTAAHALPPVVAD